MNRFSSPPLTLPAASELLAPSSELVLLLVGRVGVADAASAFARFLRLDLDSPDAAGGGFATVSALMVDWSGVSIDGDEECCLQ